MTFKRSRKNSQKKKSTEKFNWSRKDCRQQQVVHCHCDHNIWGNQKHPAGFNTVEEIEHYIPPVIQCSKFCLFGHTRNVCYSEQLVCKFCSGSSWHRECKWAKQHDGYKSANKNRKCANWQGNYSTKFKVCLALKYTQIALREANMT